MFAPCWTKRQAQSEIKNYKQHARLGKPDVGLATRLHVPHNGAHGIPELHDAHTSRTAGSAWKSVRYSVHVLGVKKKYAERVERSKSWPGQLFQ